MGSSGPADPVADLAGIAALGDPVRRALYGFVAAQDEPVSRELAATGTGVALHVAKFHLDRLEAEGLLEVTYGRPQGRGGPGAGRPAKLYRRADRDIAVSLPPRQYELVGRILADAVTTAQATGAPLADALRDAAHAAGREQAQADPASLPTLLAAQGFEPRAEAGAVTLANCPFHRLAAEHTELICGLNLDFVRGLLAGLGEPTQAARLDPAPGRCCVVIAAGG